MDVYKIAVNLAVSSNAPHFFAALSHQLAHVHTQVRDLHGSLNRVQVGLAGALSVGVGVGLIKGLKQVTDHARELSKELATLKTFNLKPIEIKQAQETARRTTTLVPGSTESGNLKILAESYSLFGLENAKKINEPLSRAAQVFGAIDGNYKGAQDTLYSLLKSGEMMGKLVDEKTHKVSPEKLLKYLDVVSKVAAATGNKVNAQTLFGIAQQGAPAMANMSDDGLMSVLMAAQAMGGMRAGTAMTSLYQQFIGGTMTKDKAEKLHELGLVGDFTSVRGGVKWKKGALDTPFARQLADNPLDAMKTLMGKMEEHGIKGTEAQTKYLFQILGRQTTQRIVNDFVRNLPQMMEEQGRIKQAQGMDAQAKTRNEEDYGTAEHNMHAAWENLMEAIAGPNAKSAIGVMNSISGGLNSLTQAVRNTNPETIVAIAKGIGILGLALIGAGATAILAALGPAGWLVLGVSAGLQAWATLDPGAFSNAMRAIKNAAVYAYDTAKAYLNDPAVMDRVTGFWRATRGAALSIYENAKAAALSPEVLTTVRQFWETTKQEGRAIYTSLKEMIQDPKSGETVRGTLTTTMDEVKWILGWYRQIKEFLTASQPQGENKPFDLKSLGINWNGDLLGQFSTYLIKTLNELDKKLYDVAQAVGNEIKSWPSRLGTAISEMGSSLVTMIGDMLKNALSSLNPFSRTSFEGGAGGMGGLVHRASYGGGGLGPDGGGGSGIGHVVARGAFGPGTGAGDSWYEAIMRAEGTAGKDPYNVVLGNGKYGLPEKPLTDMTLAEVYRFGRSVRARHGTSSAVGAFQIVGRTMKEFMGRVGLGWGDKFSPENQRKLADAIRKEQGWGAWEGFKVHRGELGNARKLKPLEAPPRPPTAGPPPKPQMVHNITVPVSVGEHKLAHVMHRVLTASARHPTSTGGMDTHGHYRPPGTTLTDTA